MFKRKIEKYLHQWKRDEHKMPLIIKGCRQCGKTSSVLDFTHKNYKHVVYLDFFQHLEYSNDNYSNDNYSYDSFSRKYPLFGGFDL